MLFAIALVGDQQLASSRLFSSHSSPTPNSAGGGPSEGRVCLGFTDIFIAFVLVSATIYKMGKLKFPMQIVLILATVLGNVLVVLSVFMYKVKSFWPQFPQNHLKMFAANANIHQFPADLAGNCRSPCRASHNAAGFA